MLLVPMLHQCFLLKFHDVQDLSLIHIWEGGLVAFPTETVYGLGADALNAEAAAKIYAAKGRPSDNPLIVHIHDISQVYEIAEEVPDEAKAVMEKFWQMCIRDRNILLYCS